MRIIEAQYSQYEKYGISKEQFDLVTLNFPKCSVFILNGLIKLSPIERNEFLFYNTEFRRIKDIINDFYTLANGNIALEQGLIKSKDINAEMKPYAGSNIFDKLKAWKMNQESAKAEFTSVPQNEYDILYQDSQWVCVRVKSWKASVYFGRYKCKNASTCVSRPDTDSFFNRYTSEPAPILIFVRHLPFDEIGACLFKSNHSREISNLQNNHNKRVEKIIPDIPEELLLILDKLIPPKILNIEYLSKQSPGSVTQENGIYIHLKVPLLLMQILIKWIWLMFMLLVILIFVAIINSQVLKVHHHR